MYLKSQTELNHENPIQSQPHGSEPLSPQNKREKSRKKQKKGEENLASRRKTPKSHADPKKPHSPTTTLTQEVANQTIDHPTTPWAPPKSP